jgi:hypothetical protein
MSPTFIAHFWERVRIGGPDECWPWQAGKDARGYGAVRANGVKKVATHVAFLLTYGRWPAPGLFLLHSCDNPPCVNPAHLREGDRAANIRDAIERGQMWWHRGSAHRRAVLTEELVMEMRRRFQSGEKPSAIALTLGKKLGTVERICYQPERYWSHVPTHGETA